MARFLLHIMAAFAELEREIIRERVMAGVGPRRPMARIWAGRNGYSGAMKPCGCVRRESAGARSRPS